MIRRIWLALIRLFSCPEAKCAMDGGPLCEYSCRPFGKCTATYEPPRQY